MRQLTHTPLSSASGSQNRQASASSSVEKTDHSAPISDTYSFALPATGYVRIPVVSGVCGLGKSTIWRWCAEGKFPKPTKLGERVSAWPVAELRAWLADPHAWQAANKVV